tara:strand:- start:502 stop:681 length:180 start_codon:yes stop_codon:yes gene_type:complete
MANQYYRDPNNNNALVNTSNSYSSRLATKKNFRNQREEISDLKTQLAELKVLVDSITSV